MVPAGREREGVSDSLDFIGWQHWAQVSPQGTDNQPVNSKLNYKSTAKPVTAGVTAYLALYITSQALTKPVHNIFEM